MDTSNQHLLRTGLAANAAFSAFTGLLLTLAPGTVNDWLGLAIPGWLRLLGVALLGHAVILAIVLRLDRPEPLAKLNLAAIAPYPLLMVGLVVADVVSPTGGQALVLLDGAVVGMVAVLQALGLRGAGSNEPQLA